MTETRPKPIEFWINSMGEYGHKYDNGEESVCGSINLTDLAKFHHKKVDQLTERDIKDAFNRDLYDEATDPREVIVYRMWESLQALSGSLFRFHGGWSAERNGDLEMTIEYIIPDDQPERAALLKQHASQFDGEVEEMWTNERGSWSAPSASNPRPFETHPEDWTYTPDDYGSKPGEQETQYAVAFNVYGESLPAVAAKQIAWLTATAQLDGGIVSVI